MSVIHLASHSPSAVRGALVRRGVDAVRAEAVAAGLQPVALLLDDLNSFTRDAVAHAAGERGIQCLTGDGWALVAGSASSVASLTRADALGLPTDVLENLGRFLAPVFDPPASWDLACGSLSLERPVVVGILNLTPDSFSDGGRYAETAAALEHAEEMLRQGAGMLDVGAESTRPGRPDPVLATQEWERLAPVLGELVRRFPDVPLSVDTVKSETARRALDAGAWAINDVSGLRLDPGIADACAEHGAGLALMHSRGSVEDMATYDHATYRNVAGDVAQELSESVDRARSRGVAVSKLALDPGFGFAKRPEQNFELLSRLSSVALLGQPVMVGPSRKRFLEAATGKGVTQRDPATVGACVTAYWLGARLFRVHSVGPAVDALAVAHAVASV